MKLLMLISLVHGILVSDCVSRRMVTDKDLERVSGELWEADTNRLNESQFTTNTAGKEYFTHVDESVFSWPTFKALLNLLDNYDPYIGRPDSNTQEHRREQDEFLNKVMKTKPMRILHKFLSDKGYASSSVSGFLKDLKQYWFTPYSRCRGAALDSSGFEHVFVGEIKNGKVIGFHGWVNFYMEEQDGSLTFIRHLGFCQPRTRKLSMRWLNSDKPCSSMFVGTSPEYEFAVYTLCFVTRAGQSCPTSSAGHSGIIKSHKMENVRLETISTVYPEC